MLLVKLDTGFNIEVEFPLSPFHRRFFAWLIDAAINATYVWLGSKLLDALTDYTWNDKMWGQVLFMLPVLFYHLICEVSMNGQSIGKRARKIKVARLDGGQPTLGQYLLRWVLRFVDNLFFLGAVVILFNGKGQRLGDLAAGTTVISLKQRAVLADTLGMDVPEQHDVTFPEAVHLTDAHARLVKDVLGNTSDVRPTLLVKLAQRLQGELNVTTQLTPEQFLRTLLKDYQYLTSR